MLCKKCKKEIPDESKFCNYCGTKQIREKSVKTRGNGQGSVFKLPNGKYKAMVTVGYYTNAEGKQRRKTHSQVFTTKKEAISALPRLLSEPEAEEDHHFQRIV